MKTPLAVRRARLFRTIWRINGIYLFLIGTAAAVGALVGVGALIYAALVSFAPRSTGRVVAAVEGHGTATDAQGKPTPLKMELRQAEPVRGTRWRMMAQVEKAEKSGRYKFSSYEYSGDVRNFLFLNTEDLSRHFLLPNVDAVILDTERLGESNASSKKPVRWIEYHVVRTDTNDDEHLDGQDRFDIAYSDAAGNGYTALLSDVKDVLGTEMRGLDTRLVIYAKQGGTFAALLDLKNHRVVRNESLPTSGSQD